MDRKEMKTSRIFLHWLVARRVVLLYQAAVFGFFFLVYALYAYPWGVAGYAALLGGCLGLGLALWDFMRFCRRHRELQQLAGRFPLGPLPGGTSLLEADYIQIAAELEAERKRLEALNEATCRDADEYYTLWAHQIKTPLAAMRLLLQSDEGAPSGVQSRSFLQELLRTGQYVDMVLQYQRLQSVQNDLLLRPCKVGELAKKAAKNCATLFICKNLSLTVKAEKICVVTDEKWLCFVLEQLFSNAVKYTAAGGVQVYEEGPDTLVIEDSGCGIPPEDLPRVFERGFTGLAGRAERSSTGIGLYLCREILQKMGFGIRLESNLGRGTRVLLCLAQPVLEVE